MSCSCCDAHYRPDLMIWQIYENIIYANPLPHTEESVKDAHTYRQQSLNIFLHKGGDVLPVQDVDQPAVLSLTQHLLTAVASVVSCVLEMDYFVSVIFLKRDKSVPNIKKLNGQAWPLRSFPHYLHKPGVVQSVPKLQNLFLNHSSVVHLVS